MRVRYIERVITKETESDRQSNNERAIDTLRVIVRERER